VKLWSLPSEDWSCDNHHYCSSEHRNLKISCSEGRIDVPSDHKTRQNFIQYFQEKSILWSVKYDTFLIFCMLKLPCFYGRLWNYVQWLWQDLLWKPHTCLNFCIDINLTSSLIHECNDYLVIICSVLHVCTLQKGLRMLCFIFLWDLGTEIDVMELNDIRICAKFAQIEPELNKGGFVWMLGYIKRTWIFFAVRSVANTNSPPSKSSFKYRMALQVQKNEISKVVWFVNNLHAV
jgi:hypothetical protein